MSSQHNKTPRTILTMQLTHIVDDTNLCLNSFSKYFNNHIFREVNFIAHNISSIQDSNPTKPSNSKWTKPKIDWSDHWFSWRQVSTSENQLY